MQNDSITILIPLTKTGDDCLSVPVPSVDQIDARARDYAQLLGLSVEDAIAQVSDQMYEKYEAAIRITRQRARRALVRLERAEAITISAPQVRIVPEELL